MTPLLLVLACVVLSFGQENHTIPIGPGFWNVRSSFIISGFDIGTQMSLIQLKNGRFLVLDTVALDAGLKADIDKLTNGGSLIDAVIATHPFHTVFFPAFYQVYPNTSYYGTPRHLRIQPQIPWKGTVWDCNVRQMWNPEVRMRIPQGSAFVDPQPESSNHFNGMHVFHVASKTFHVDDTIIIDEPFKGDMIWHPTLLDYGLFHTGAAPFAFRDWVQKYLNEWDFDNIVAAHNGVKKGGAKAQVQDLLFKTGVVFDLLTIDYTATPNATEKAAFDAMQAHEAQCKE